jgi:hypothetical protein
MDSPAVTPHVTRQRGTATGPLIPDYAGPNVRGIVPALLGPGSWATSLPPWMPEPVAAADQVVLLVLDGLGWEQFEEHRHLLPTLASMSGGPITTVAPTTTATALSSIATGLTPAEHGLLGYRMLLGGEVLNVLRWTSDGADRRRMHPPRDVQPFAAFLGHDVPVVSPAELQGTAFTEGHLFGSRPVGYRAISSLPVEVGRQLRAGERFVYAYYGNIDKTAHERGFGEFYDAELRYADRLIGDLLDVLPDGAVLMVTADHGQVDVGDRIIDPDPGLLEMVATQSGEGRFRWWHARPGDDPGARRGRPRALPGRRLGRHPRAGDRRALVRTRDRRADRRPPGRRRPGHPRPGELPRPDGFGPLRARLPPRVADLRRGARPAAGRRSMTAVAPGGCSGRMDA